MSILPCHTQIQIQYQEDTDFKISSPGNSHAAKVWEALGSLLNTNMSEHEFLLTGI